MGWDALWLRPMNGACASDVWHGSPYGCGRHMGPVLNMFCMGRPMAAAALRGVCLICLAWATLWLWPPYGACAQYVWHGPPYVCGRPMGRVLNMFGMGRPMAAAALLGMCLICLAWAALWLRLSYGACAQYVWHGPPYGCGQSVGAVWCVRQLMGGVLLGTRCTLRCV